MAGMDGWGKAPIATTSMTTGEMRNPPRAPRQIGAQNAQVELAGKGKDKNAYLNDGGAVAMMADGDGMR
jgi:hypothetical protein